YTTGDQSRILLQLATTVQCLGDRWLLLDSLQDRHTSPEPSSKPYRRAQTVCGSDTKPERSDSLPPQPSARARCNACLSDETSLRDQVQSSSRNVSAFDSTGLKRNTQPHPFSQKPEWICFCVKCAFIMGYEYDSEFGAQQKRPRRRLLWILVGLGVVTFLGLVTAGLVLFSSSMWAERDALEGRLGQRVLASDAALTSPFGEEWEDNPNDITQWKDFYPPPRRFEHNDTFRHRYDFRERHPPPRDDWSAISWRPRTSRPPRPFLNDQLSHPNPMDHGISAADRIPPNYPRFQEPRERYYEE
ncbi:unnamed protein product, partial [Cyprideis torosa]